MKKNFGDQQTFLIFQSSHWIGTIILSTCELIERPSKKDGFCFKLFHPMDQSIWAARGPDGEAIGAVVQPLPTSHCIFRAPNSAAGKCWMDALELALRCSSLLLRTMASSTGSNNSASAAGGASGSAGASNATENLGSVFNRLSSTSDSGSVCEVTLKGDKVIDDMRACASDLEDDFDDEEDEEEEDEDEEDSVNGGPSRRITTDSKYVLESKYYISESKRTQ